MFHNVLVASQSRRRVPRNRLAPDPLGRLAALLVAHIGPVGAMTGGRVPPPYTPTLSIAGDGRSRRRTCLPKGLAQLRLAHPRGPRKWKEPFAAAWVLQPHRPRGLPGHGLHGLSWPTTLWWRTPSIRRSRLPSSRQRVNGDAASSPPHGAMSSAVTGRCCRGWSGASPALLHLFPSWLSIPGAVRGLIVLVRAMAAFLVLGQAAIFPQGFTPEISSCSCDSGALVHSGRWLSAGRRSEDIPGGEG